jgi:endo-1,4-beta-xylanase
VQTVVGERLAAGWTFSLPAGAPPPAGQTVLSTDFEEGLDGWNARDNGTGAPTVAITTADKHAGEQAAAVTARTSQGSGIGHDVTGLLEPGVAYEASAWIKFATGQPAGDVWLTIARTVEGTTTYQTLGQFDGQSNSAWVQVKQTFTMGEADEAYLYFETAYSGTNTSDFFIDDIVVSTPDPLVVEDLEPIKNTVDFPVGVAIDSRETVGAASELLLRHFDQVTSENFMKPEAWYNAEGEFTPNPEADTLMEYAQDNDLAVYGHTLVWHSQTPAWFFQTEGGQPLTSSDADKQVLRERMREHIFNVAEYLSDTYGAFGSDTNPLYAFDVVNEVVADGSDFEDGLRRSEWYRILGEEYIYLAFDYANEAFNDEFAADGATHPVTLFINDYNTEQAGKQQRLRALVERMLENDVPVDGVGHQFHVSLSMPVSALEAAIVAFEDLGLTQAVTELDVTTGTPVSQASLIEQGYYYRDAFRVFREHDEDLFSVTVWGLTDGRSWRAANGDPLVFNDSLQAKPAYYGIVDDELPARQRTALVFEGSVALDADAPAALEWAQLPLHRIDDATAFQLRWSADHLTAYVTVEDATVDASDGVEFALEGQDYSFNRSGSGDVEGVVSEFPGGYAIVVHLPVDGAALADNLALDVRVADGASVVAWNTPGALGTLTLVEPLSYVEVVAAATAPEIDADIEEAWDDAGTVTTTKQVQGTGGAVATVRTLWSGSKLYVLAEVADPVVDVTGSDPWVQDSVEIYVDAGNVKNGSYRYDDTQIRISAANAVSFGTGDEAFQEARVVSATTLVDGGYVVEAEIDLLEASGIGTFHGLDFQVNDASNGARDAIRNWADPTGAGYQSTARWGVGQLVAGVDPDGPEITLSAGEVVAGGTIAFELSGFEPGAEVTIKLQDDVQPAAHAGRSALQLAAVVLPATLGVVTVDESGEASGAAVIPADTPVGTYLLTASVQGTVVASAGLSVIAAADPGGELPPGVIAMTGLSIAGALWAALGLLIAGVALMIARRREKVAGA